MFSLNLPSTSPSNALQALTEAAIADFAAPPDPFSKALFALIVALTVLAAANQTVDLQRHLGRSGAPARIVRVVSRAPAGRLGGRRAQPQALPR